MAAIDAGVAGQTTTVIVGGIALATLLGFGRVIANIRRLETSRNVTRPADLALARAGDGERRVVPWSMEDHARAAAEQADAGEDGAEAASQAELVERAEERAIYELWVARPVCYGCPDPIASPAQATLMYPGSQGNAPVLVHHACRAAALEREVVAVARMGRRYGRR